MKHRILVADADAGVAAALQRLFADDQAIELTTVSSADAALQHLGRAVVDLVVADMMRTSDNGTELLAEVRRLRPELPVLLLTERAPKHYAELQEQLGKDLPVVSKPWDVNELRSKVLEQLDGDIESASEEQLLISVCGIAPKRIERAKRIQGRMENPLPLPEVLIQMGDLTQAQLDGMQRKRQSSMSLIEILQDNGELSTTQAEAFEQAKQESPGLTDFDLLVGNQVVSERAYLEALAQKHEIPYLEPDINNVDAKILAKASFRYLLRNAILPIDVKDDKLRVVMATPLNDQLVHEVQRIFKVPLAVAACTRGTITEALRTLQRLDGSQGKRETSLEYRVIEDLPKDMGSGDEAVQIVDYVILRAIQLGASDLHLEPMQTRMRVRVRVDGVLQTLTELPKDAVQRVVSRMKILASADISERRLHQDGKILVKAQGGEVDIRMSSYVSVHGETIVLRLLDRNRGLVPMERLGFVPKIRTAVEEVILPTSTGLVLVTGPTGSGKTTTLYSFLQHHIDPSEKVITAEDPVEYVTNGIVQCPVNEKTGPTFADSLRAMLRQDPDTIVVGEMRDGTTAGLAFEAALTGHKVYSTFHTDDSVVVAIRLLEMGIEPFLISSALNAVLAQRLLRRLCKHCKEPSRITAKQQHFLQINADDFKDGEFCAPQGCPRCDDTGYKGRIGIHEVLMPDDDFKDAVLSRSPSKVLRELARQQPQFLSLQEDGLIKAAKGETSVEELVSNLPRNVPPRTHSQLKAIAGARRSK